MSDYQLDYRLPADLASGSSVAIPYPAGLDAYRFAQCNYVTYDSGSNLAQASAQVSLGQRSIIVTNTTGAAWSAGRIVRMQIPFASSTPVVRGRYNKVLLVGDSITQNNTTTGAASSYHNTIGCFGWANAFMKQRLAIQYNAAVGGMSAGSYQSNSLRTNIGSYLSSYNAPYVACLIGTNDVAASRSASQIINDLDYIYKSCVDAGRVVLASTILPRLSGGSGLTSAQLSALMAVNAWIKEQNYRANGVIASDPFRYACDPTSATSDPFTNETYDASTVGLHPSAAMAMRVGEVWADDWGDFIQSASRYVGGPGDTYDSTNNPYGNLLSNGCLQTVTSSGGTGYSGNNPTGYTIQRVTGAGTWAGSAVARTDGVPGNWYRATITSESNASAQYQMRQNVFGPNGGGSNTYAIGDQVYGEAEISVTHTGSTNYVRGVYVTITEYDRDGTQVMVAAGLYRTALTNPFQRAKDYTAVVRTPTITTTGSSGTGGASQRITVSIDVLFDGSVSNALTVNMGELRLRKEVD